MRPLSHTARVCYPPPNVMSVAVCILIHGAAGFFEAGREAAHSLLRHTSFPLFIAHDGAHSLDLPASPRLTFHRLPPLSPSVHRARRFLLKFTALQALLNSSRADRILMMDADTVVTRRLSERMIRLAMGPHPLAMVEQTGITGSTMSRREFLAHYTRHTLALLAPGAPPPPIERFRYFNSGVVLGVREEWNRLVTWALTAIAGHAGEHQVGEHMIADQDYFQYWANTLHPGCCAELPWCWNHCEHWDAGFPRPGVLLAHFSNFCNGPAPGTSARMRALARTPRWKLWLSRVTHRRPWQVPS